MSTTTQKKKKTASQKRNNEIAITGRARQPYEVLLDNIHQICPGNTYLEQVTDPANAPLVSYPGDGQSSAVRRFGFSTTVYPDANGRISATVSYNPFNLLDVQSGGTGTSASTVSTVYGVTPGQQWLFTSYPPPVLPTTEPYGNEVPMGVIPVCSMAGNGINVPGGGAPATPSLPCYQAIVPLPAGNSSLCNLYPTAPGANIQAKCNLVVETGATATPAYTLYTNVYDTNLSLIATYLQGCNPCTVGSTKFFLPLATNTMPANAAYVAYAFNIPTPGWTLTVDPNVGAIDPIILNVVQTNSINRVVHEAPGFTKAYLNGDVLGYRVISVAGLFSNETSDLANQGGIAGGIIPGGARLAVTAPPSYDYLTTLDEWKKDGPAKVGMRGFLTYENKIQAEAWRYSANIAGDPTLPIMCFALELGVPPTGITAQAQTYRIRVDAIIEFKTVSQLIGRRKGRIAPMELDEAFALLRATPRFCDNPLHEKLINGVKRAWEVVQKYGPGAINLATKTLKYAPLVMAALA